jgi:hypothetical protein
MTLTINQLSQEEADNLMRKLFEPLENFKIAFQSESQNIRAGRPVALPTHERIYYLIKVQDYDFLFVGINPSYDDMFLISSFARITAEMKGHAEDCLKNLIEEKLVPMCQEKRKKFITCNAATQGSYNVFKKLKEKSIKGINWLKIERRDIDSYTVTMEVINVPL